MSRSEKIKPVHQLFPPQKEVVEGGFLTTGFNCILQMPTGSGKTWLAEMAIEEVIGKNKKAIYLSPIKALASSLYDKWQQRFPNHQVGIFTGDYSTRSKFPVPYKDSDILIMTPERLDACVRSWRSNWGWIPLVDLIISDEFHLIGDKNRGARLEGTLLRFVRLNPFSRILGLSATLGNRGELAEWLDGIEYFSKWRPIPLETEVRYFKKADEKPYLLLDEVEKGLSQGGRMLVFVQSRRRAESLAAFLQKENIKAHHHHAGLTYETRQEIEAVFQGRMIEVLVATATLEMGVNFPVRKVILYDLQYFNGSNFEPLPINNVWQRIGRAGRYGLDDKGEAVLLCPSWINHKYDLTGFRFDEILSGLRDERNLIEQVLIEISCGFCTNTIQLERVFRSSLAFRQGFLPNLSGRIQSLIKEGLMKETTNDRGHLKLKPTRLGRIVVQHMVSTQTVILLSRFSKVKSELSFFDLLLVASCCLDASPVLAIDFEEIEDLGVCLSKERSRLLTEHKSELLRWLEISGKRLLASIKMAIVAHTFTQGKSLKDIADIYSCYPFEVSLLRDNLLRVLYAFAAIFETANEEGLDEISAEKLLKEKVNALIKMLETGLNAQNVTLTFVKGIGATLARRIVEIGISDIEELALAYPEELKEVKGISPQRAVRMIQEAEGLIKQKSAFFFKENTPRIQLSSGYIPKDINVYRLIRSKELQVEQREKRFKVWGGSDPHVVFHSKGNWRCDCKDYQNGNQCKHILAVRHKCGDAKLQKAWKALADNPDAPISLINLWYT